MSSMVKELCLPFLYPWAKTVMATKKKKKHPLLMKCPPECSLICLVGHFIAIKETRKWLIHQNRGEHLMEHNQTCLVSVGNKGRMKRNLFWNGDMDVFINTISHKLISFK